MDNKKERIYALLESKNVRLTLQRKEILSVFLNTNKHLKPEDVHDSVKDKGIGLATVYRTIEILKDNDIIQEVTMENIRYYELKLYGEKCLHIHFKCDNCGAMFDCDNIKLGIKMIELRDLTESLCNVEAKNVTVTMNGICNKCKR